MTSILGRFTNISYGCFLFTVIAATFERGLFEVVEAAEADSGLSFLLTLVGVLIVLALGLLEADEAGLEDFLLEVSTSEYFSGAYFLISDSFRAPADEVARALRVLLTRSLCLCSENEKKKINLAN